MTCIIDLTENIVFSTAVIHIISQKQSPKYNSQRFQIEF